MPTLYQNKLTLKTIFLIFIALLFFICDFLNKYLTLKYGYEISISIYARSFFAIIFFIGSVVFLNKKRAFILAVILILVLGFITVGIFSYFREYGIYKLIKYLYVFILFMFFMSNRNYTPKDIRYLQYTYRIFVVSNAVAILVGALFNIVFFKTYYLWTWRTGYNGFFPGQNEATFFYIFSIILYFKFSNIIKITKLEQILLLISVVFVGTKGLYLFSILFFIYLYKKVLLPFIFFGFIYIYYNQSLIGRAINMKSDFLYDVFENKGFMHMALSGRNYLFENNFFTILDSWTPINYLFGGQTIFEQTELGFVDLFLFFGIVGFIVYMVGYLYLLRKMYLTKLCPFCIILIFTINALQSHLFDSALTPIYLLLFSLIVKYSYIYKNRYFKNV